MPDFTLTSLHNVIEHFRRNKMLDIKFVRENQEVVKQNIRNKFQDNKLELVDKVL